MDCAGKKQHVGPQMLCEIRLDRRAFGTLDQLLARNLLLYPCGGIKAIAMEIDRWANRYTFYTLACDALTPARRYPFPQKRGSREPLAFAAIFLESTRADSTPGYGLAPAWARTVRYPPDCRLRSTGRGSSRFGQWS